MAQQHHHRDGGAELSLSSLCVHAGEEPRVDGAAVMPIFQTSTFLNDDDTSKGYDDVRYTRCNNNPTQLAVARKLAALEGTEAALVLGSGMAAISSTLLALLSAGDALVTQAGVYGGTHGFMRHDLARWDVRAVAVDACASVDAWERALDAVPRCRVLYCEAIANPLIAVPDLPGLAALAKRRGLTSVIDATFATPINLRPAAELGFDVVLHSATKYLGGHSDLCAGAVCASRALIRRITSTANHLGGAIDPHVAFLLQRGLKTLALRVERHNHNAAMLAAALEAHPAVARVHHPSLASHPRAALVREVFRGAGGMLAFECASAAVASAALAHLRLGLVAPSLGGVDTLVTRPVVTTHSGMTPGEREAVGVSDALVRVSVGIEDADDLVADFVQALDAALAAVGGNGGGGGEQHEAQ